MRAFLQNSVGVLSLITAFVYFWVLRSEWNSASPNRFQGMIASASGFLLFAFGFFLDAEIIASMLRVAGLLLMMLGGLLQARDLAEKSKLPKGTRIKRVVNSLKFLGVPIWRKVVSTEILTPEMTDSEAARDGINGQRS